MHRTCTLPVMLLTALLGWNTASATAIDFSPLEVRNLSLANTTAPALKNADPTALTTDLGPKIIPWLMACSRWSYLDLPGVGEDVYRIGAGALDENGQKGPKREVFFEAPWLARALSAYLRVRHLATPGEKARLEQWFADNAAFDLKHMQDFLVVNFPNRLSGDYATTRNASSAPGYGGRKTIQGGDDIPNLAGWYNNRRTLAYTYLLMAGVAFADTRPAFSAQLLAEVKRYIKEWVMFSVWPTGEVGEWLRNHEYANSDGDYAEAQGVTYNAYNSALALTAALVLYQRHGDRDLIDWRTRAGLWGTECAAGEPDKSIWTASDLHIDMLAGVQTRINDSGANMYVLFNYERPAAPARMELRHATWYLPAYRLLRPGSVSTARLEAWAGAVTPPTATRRADDPFGLWRNLCGISTDVRTETFTWLVPVPDDAAAVPDELPPLPGGGSATADGGQGGGSCGAGGLGFLFLALSCAAIPRLRRRDAA